MLNYFGGGIKIIRIFDNRSKTTREKYITILVEADGESLTNHNHSAFFCFLEHYGQRGKSFL